MALLSPLPRYTLVLLLSSHMSLPGSLETAIAVEARTPGPDDDTAGADAGAGNGSRESFGDVPALSPPPAFLAKV